MSRPPEENILHPSPCGTNAADNPEEHAQDISKVVDGRLVSGNDSPEVYLPSTLPLKDTETEQRSIHDRPASGGGNDTRTNVGQPCTSQDQASLAAQGNTTSSPLQEPTRSTSLQPAASASIQAGTILKQAKTSTPKNGPASNKLHPFLRSINCLRPDPPPRPAARLIFCQKCTDLLYEREKLEYHIFHDHKCAAPLPVCVDTKHRVCPIPGCNKQVEPGRLEAHVESHPTVAAYDATYAPAVAAAQAAADKRPVGSYKQCDLAREKVDVSMSATKKLAEFRSKPAKPSLALPTATQAVDAAENMKCTPGYWEIRYKTCEGCQKTFPLSKLAVHGCTSCVKMCGAVFTKAEKVMGVMAEHEVACNQEPWSPIS
ncbi:hypothetical protein EDC01DRAFT_122691 [Geopyxis carbonaria]|nr:hypothetical protein EDC01DRAFT_122691 [Geopyxis carbonaria]